MKGKSLGYLSVETETGMRIIAIKRGIRWIYDPDEDLPLKEGDVMVVRGTRTAMSASAASPWGSRNAGIPAGGGVMGPLEEMLLEIKEPLS
jgi:uncharacterized protein with PhoU and TrkA domain